MVTTRLEINGQRDLLKGIHRGIGRGAGHTVLLTDVSVSRKHTQLVTGAGAHWLRDLASRNGTSCNEQKVAGNSVALKHGAAFCLGEVNGKYAVEQSQDDQPQFTVRVAPAE